MLLKTEHLVDSRNSRYSGLFKGCDVLIKRKIAFNGDKSQILDSRINNLARLLHSEHKPEEMRTLNCIGVISDVERDKTTHKLIF
jgi:hypothetical protein